MRFYLRVLATALGLVMFTTGNAHADVPRTSDGNGVLVGSWIAPVQLEIFCEPQCPDCKAFEAADGPGHHDRATHTGAHLARNHIESICASARVEFAVSPGPTHRRRGA